MRSPDIVRFIDVSSEVGRGRWNPAFIASNFELVGEHAGDENRNVEDEKELRNSH